MFSEADLGADVERELVRVEGARDRHDVELASGQLDLDSALVAGSDGSPLAVTTEPVEVKADAPAGAGDRLPLVAENVRIERTVDGDLDRLRVGDAFTVSVRVTADATDPVMLPALQAPEVTGLTRYPGEAKTQARVDRGRYRAERVDTATYVASDWGRYSLPRVAVFWLDPSTGHYAEAVASAVDFRARVNPSLGTGLLGGPGALARAVGTVVAALALSWLALRLVRRAAAARASRARVVHTADEKAAFAVLKAAARSDADGPTLTALYRWLRLAIGGLPILERLEARADDAALGRAAGELQARIAGEAVGGHAQDLIEPLSRYRRGHRKPARGPGRLPELNARAQEARRDRDHRA